MKNLRYKQSLRHFQYRQFRPCPKCWRGRPGYRQAGGRTPEYAAMPARFNGWPFAVVDVIDKRYAIRCVKCGFTTAAYATGVGAVREWNGKRACQV